MEETAPRRRVEKCAGVKARHVLGESDGSFLYVNGRAWVHVTRSNEKQWRISRPHAPRAFEDQDAPTGDETSSRLERAAGAMSDGTRKTVWRTEPVPLLGRTPDSETRARLEHPRVIDEPAGRVRGELHVIPLPARVRCWSCYTVTDIRRFDERTAQS